MRLRNLSELDNQLKQSAAGPKRRLTVEEGIKKHGLFAIRVWGLIGVILLAIGVGYVLDQISIALQILIIAFVISFLCMPLVNKLDDLGVNRALGTLAAYVIAILIIVIVFSLVLPVLSKQVTSLIGAIPGYVMQGQQWIDHLYLQYSGLFADANVQNALKKLLDTITGTALKLANSSATGIITAGSSVVSTVAVLFMSMVVAFWFTMDFPKFHREAMIIVGPSRAEEFEIMGAVFARAMGGYLKGLLITSTCTGILAGIGFFALGVPYAGLLGLATGILNIIPFIGPWIGGGLAALVSLFVSPLTALFSVIVTVVAQQVTDTFISPKVMQSAVSVHPMLVIVGLSIGGAVGGVAGMVFAVPLIAAFKGVYTYYFEKRTGRQLISEQGAVFRGMPFNDEDGNPIPAYDATGGTKYYAAKFANPAHRDKVKRAKEIEEERERQKDDRDDKGDQGDQGSQVNKDDQDSRPGVDAQAADQAAPSEKDKS